MSKAKLERLLNLTALLLETPRPLTAGEIRARVGGYPAGDAAFRQAFERDKQDLRAMGVPLTVGRPADADAAPGVSAYRIHKDDYYLADPGLDADELAALHLASQAVRLDGLGGDEGLRKLEGSVGLRSAPLPAGADSSPDLAMAALPAHDDLGSLFGAVAGCHPVRFVYNGEARTVDPYRLEFQRGRWYLNGYDHLRQDVRVYRLDRIDERIDVSEDSVFTRPDTVDGVVTQPWLLGEGDTVTARLLVERQQAPWVENYLGPGSVVERRPDGAVVVELEVTNRESFRSFVLIFLDQAEVLGPPELREEVVSWLTELTRN